MFPLKRAPSKLNLPNREPKPSPGLAPAATALSFTLILTQLQAAYQGNRQYLMLVLIAAILVMTGAKRT